MHWTETSPWGPSLEFLCLVDDMGQARALAQDAEAMDAPTKEGRLNTRSPLARVASEHPGELVWRLMPSDSARPFPDPDDPPWAVGADAARDLRRADVERFTTVYEAALRRRSARRRHSR